MISGQCDFTLDGRTRTCSKGETYLIQAGKKHQITAHAGYAEMDFVLDFGK